MDTRAVLDHHMKAFLAGDLDEVMADYTEDSAFVGAEGTTTGLAAIRAAYVKLFDGTFRPGTYTLEVDALEVAGEVGFVQWHATTQGATVPLGTDTFVIRDGKILVQTYAARIDPA